MKHKYRMLVLCVILFLFGSFGLFADARGEEIAAGNLALKTAGNESAIAYLVLINKNGSKKVRKMKLFTRETAEGRDSYTEFLEPAEVLGTKLLTIGHREGSDEQRLYLPALGKVRRISSSRKGGSFMGSDIYFFDLEDFGLEDFTYKYLRDETYNGMDCYVVERTPVDKDAPYSRQIVWINQEDYFEYKVDCYDKKDKLLKSIVNVEVKIIEGVIIPVRTVVDNHQKKTKTLFERTEVQINVDIPASLFTLENLEN